MSSCFWKLQIVHSERRAEFQCQAEKSYQSFNEPEKFRAFFYSFGNFKAGTRARWIVTVWHELIATKSFQVDGLAGYARWIVFIFGLNRVVAQ